MAALADYVVFNDKKLGARYARRPIPIDTLFEAYFDGAIDIPGNIYKLMQDRHAVARHVFTPAHGRYFLTRFVPELAIHSKALDQKLVRGHYDRGDDFFAAFLGPRMVYTSAFFNDPGESLEDGQDQKMELVCRKLMVKPGETFLDIGCGWGTLTRYVAQNYGVDATGVTLSENQAAYGNRAIAAAGLADRARILCLDYRDIPKQRFKRIANLEMVEHVGVKNLGKFYRQVYDLLDDQGLFYMQWTGLRRRSNVEDLIWGLFMAKYIFPGADASLPLAPMMNVMEKARFEIHSVENVTSHYRVTLQRWHKNWISNREAIVAAYGERWYRIWHVFLAWAVTIAGQGTAACFQVVANKNRNDFDRSIWIGAPALAERMDLSPAARPKLQPA
jgi:cyclopropane fatty-acyl-phospholipid synthase-like methyltransferase